MNSSAPDILLVEDGRSDIELFMLAHGSMPFRVERDSLISAWPARTDELVSA
jgi:hypothetical protein